MLANNPILNNLIKYRIPLIIITVLAALIFGIIDYSYGLSAESAKSKVIRENINYSDQGQFVAGFNQESKLDILKKSELLNEFAIAGLTASGNSKKLPEYISKTIDVTRPLELFDDMYRTQVGNVYLSNCNSILGIAVQNKDFDSVKTIVEKGNITDTYSCALYEAINTGQTNIYQYLANDKGFKVSSEYKAELIKLCRTGIGQLQITSDIADVLSCENETLLDTYIPKLSQEAKDLNLRTAVDNNYTLAINKLIKAGASVESLPTLDLVALAVDKKSDAMIAYLVNKGKKLPETIKDDIPFVFAVKNNLIDTAKALVDKGFDLNTFYKPLSDKDFTIPVVYNAVSDGQKEILQMMIDKNNSVQKLDSTNKNQLLAFALDQFAKKATNNQREVLKILIAQGLDINSNLIYRTSGVYETKPYPVWSVPFIDGISFVPDEKVADYRYQLNEFFKSIVSLKPTAKFEFDNKNSLYYIANTGSIDATNYMLNNGYSIEDKVKNNSEYTVLHTLIDKSDLEGIKNVIAKKINLNRLFDDRSYINYTEAKSVLYDRPAILELLKQGGEKQ
jgi:hypothetical protein